MKKSIVISPSDTVGVALVPLKKDETVEGVTLSEDIERGHKFALRDIHIGENGKKYGEPIGHATAEIKAGSHVHTHNMATNLSGTLEYEYRKKEIEKPAKPRSRDIFVYERKGGEIGIRNELWVIPTVGCVNSQARTIVSEFIKHHGGNLPGIDGVFALTHPYGCSQVGGDLVRTRMILQKMAKHPNCGGALILGLGCENNRMDIFRKTLGEHNPERIEFLVAQDVEDEISEGVKLLERLYDNAKYDKRIKKDLSCLKIGLKCGGSDGLSGITANPLVGRFSDYLTAVGGTTVITEVPEMFGADQILMNRAKNRDVFDKIVKLINDFKGYYLSHGQPISENPSPGNIAGGITTLEDKSLGCVQKSGSSEISGVLFEVGDVTERGMNLLSGPGNDMVAVTNLACAGCHMVLFTTGRGTPFGGFVPTVKISTNSELTRKKGGWIDFDAGAIADGESFESALERLIDVVVSIANGAPTANERSGSRDLAIFKSGVTL